MCIIPKIQSHAIFSSLTWAGMSSVQVNIAAESGEMGVLANHVPSIEQLKPGLIEIIEESGGTKQFFRMSLSSVESYKR